MLRFLCRPCVRESAGALNLLSDPPVSPNDVLGSSGACLGLGILKEDADPALCISCYFCLGTHVLLL